MTSTYNGDNIIFPVMVHATLIFFLSIIDFSRSCPFAQNLFDLHVNFLLLTEVFSFFSFIVILLIEASAKESGFLH